MLPVYFFVISFVLAVTESAPPSKFSQDQYIGNENNSQLKTLTKRQQKRPTRSYGHFDVSVEFWTEPSLNFLSYPYPAPNSLGHNFGKYDHITPDFSNGLDYPDSLLLTGPLSERAVSYLYSRELFFGNIPHVRAVLRNQEERRANGLSENRIGTSRIGPLFQRFRTI